MTDPNEPVSNGTDAEGQTSDAGLDHGTATDSQGNTVALPNQG